MDLSCIAAALCFIIANALGVAVVALDINRDFFDFESWKAFDPDYIQAEWAHRRAIAPLFQTSNIFNAIGWFFFAIPIVQLAWALSRGGKRKIGVHAAIAAFALGGCFTELISRLLIFGGWSSANWISTSFNLQTWLPSDIGKGSNDNIGFRALEVSFIIVEGLVLWIDAFEWICLFCILILLYYSVGTQMIETRTLSLWWARLGLFIAFLTFVDFSADILRLEDWRTFAQIAMAISFINTVLLLPIWLVMLSCNLHKALPAYTEGRTDDWTPQVQMTP